jgi:hypothetical protein
VSRTKYTYATGGKYVAISTPYTAEYTPYTAECSNPWISQVVEESRVNFLSEIAYVIDTFSSLSFSLYLISIFVSYYSAALLHVHWQVGSSQM